MISKLLFSGIIDIILEFLCAFTNKLLEEDSCGVLQELLSISSLFSTLLSFHFQLRVNWHAKL